MQILARIWELLFFFSIQKQEPTKDFPFSEQKISGFPRRLMNLHMQLIVESVERLSEISKWTATTTKHEIRRI